MKTVLYFKTIENLPARKKLAGFLGYARNAEWNVYTVPSNSPDIRTLLNFWKPDGCAINAASGNNNFNGSAFYGIPSVFIDRPPVTLLPSDSYIYHNSAATVRLAMCELLRHTPASCAFVSWPVDHAWNKERMDEYLSIAYANGIKPHVHSTKCNIDNNARLQSELIGFLASLPLPAAILAAADPLGVQIIDACRIAGLSVPEDVSVIGIDNDEELCETSEPALSSVAPDHFEAGRRAAEMLESLMEDRLQPPFKETYASPLFTIRGSSLRLKRPDHDAVTAMELIRKGACGKLDVSAVLAQFRCSRRNAEYRFRAATGMSVAEAIRKVRYETARSMLETGKMSVSAIADFCGYNSIAAFSRFFKSISGTCPRNTCNSRKRN